MSAPGLVSQDNSPQSARSWLRYLLVSFALVIPCFWHAHIEAGDLGSHLYNSWLAQLAEQGRAPGIYVVWQWQNVLFDLLLFYLSKLVGLAVAEKVAVSLCVLIFFWGVFALASAVARRAPWFVMPGVAMLAYGYTFHMGYMNYYLSLGLACFGLAALWDGRGTGLLVAAILAVPAFMAHPIGFAWLAGAGLYRRVWLRFRGWPQFVVPAVAVAFLVAVRWFLVRHPSLAPDWSELPFYHWNGFDQFMVFGERYEYIAGALVLLSVAATVLGLWRRDSTESFWAHRKLVLECYLISFCATALLPENLRPDPHGSWIGGLVSRLTLISAIFVFCWLATLPARAWHLAAFGACACVFFVFVYQDTAYLNRMEASAEGITRELPFGTRVTATMFGPPGYRTIYIHLVDRACIGHCFLVSNYEPATGKFRVRVSQRSRVAVSSVDDSEDMQSGTYDVQEEDLPLKQVYQCDDRDLTRLCIRDLKTDEKNDRVGYKPASNPFFQQNP